MLTDYPEILEQWDYEKNTIDPKLLTRGSGKRVWWRCSKKDRCNCHTWMATVGNRIHHKSGCPFCSGRRVCAHNNLLFLNPKLAEEWDYVRNERGPETYMVTSHSKAWWWCSKGGGEGCDCHNWLAGIRDRVSGHGCPYCSKRKICAHNNLLFLNPKLAEEWDYVRNDRGPENFATKSGVKVWWMCSNGEGECDCHVWQAKIVDRTAGSGCPFCEGGIRRACPHRNFKTEFPKIAEEWDYERNEKGPEEYTPFSKFKAWWICTQNPCGCHRWNIAINTRANKGNGCAFCCNQKICEHNNFLALNPDLAKEWDYDKNKADPSKLAPSTRWSAWWICSKNQNHKWKATLCSRVSCESGCPRCRVSKGEKAVAEWLTEHKIKFESEKKFRGCNDKKPLRIDFYLPDHNACIEYDGEQHFSSTCYISQLSKDFEGTVRRDITKMRFIHNKLNGSILRISYEEKKEIPEILQAFIFPKSRIDRFCYNMTGSVNSQIILDMYEKHMIDAIAFYS